MTRDIHKEMTEASNNYAQSITDSVGVQSMLSIAFAKEFAGQTRTPQTRTLRQ